MRLLGRGWRLVRKGGAGMGGFVTCGAIYGLDGGGRRVREEFEKRRGLALGGGCVRSSFYFVCKVCIVSKALITRLDYHFLAFIVCRASRVLMT